MDRPLVRPTRIMLTSRLRPGNDCERLPTSSADTVVSRGTDQIGVITELVWFTKLSRSSATDMVCTELGMDTEGLSIYYNGTERNVQLSNFPFI